MLMVDVLRTSQSRITLLAAVTTGVAIFQHLAHCGLLPNVAFKVGDAVTEILVLPEFFLQEITFIESNLRC